MKIRTRVALLLATGALVVGCTAGDDGTASEDTTATGDTTASSVPSGPAPGVTDDTIRVGVTFVDLESIGDVATLDHGDYAAAYQAMFDHINQEGGINGRMIDATIVGINPVGTDSADAACVQLTQDEQVFAAMGFVQADGVTCYTDTHQTAFFGGSQTPELLARARAPWYTAASGSDTQLEVITKMADEGELDGTLGVFGAPQQQAQIEDEVQPLLDELGVDVAETVIADIPTGSDLTASNAAVRVAVERFDAAGVDQVLVVGQSALSWLSGAQETDYRPQLLFTQPDSAAAYANDPAQHDVAMLDGAVAGNPYGPNQNTWSLPGMQECIQIVEDAGVPVPEPDSLPEDSGDVFLAGLTACNDVTLFQALVTAAGEDLNYGSLVAGAEGLEVELPAQPEPLTYGSPPHADGDVPAYLYDWDTQAREFVLRED